MAAAYTFKLPVGRRGNDKKKISQRGKSVGRRRITECRAISFDVRFCRSVKRRIARLGSAYGMMRSLGPKKNRFTVSKEKFQPRKMSSVPVKLCHFFSFTDFVPLSIFFFYNYIANVTTDVSIFVRRYIARA